MLPERPRHAALGGGRRRRCAPTAGRTPLTLTVTISPGAMVLDSGENLKREPKRLWLG